MPYRELVPHPALAPFVDRLWIRGAGAAETARVLPDGCVDVILDVASGDAFVVGPMTRPLVLAEASAASMIAVRFRPGAAPPFVGTPACALTDARVDCGALGLGWLSEREERTDLVAAARALERRLLQRLAVVPRPDPLVAHAVGALLGPAPPRIEALAARIGWSRQHLGRVFRAQVGLGPKELARVARVQRAVAALQRAPGQHGPAGLAALAAAAGYFDEAHMDREFRALVGVTPRLVKAAAGSIRPITSLFGVA
jgi:AraC-like DNA-binding protein